MLLFPYAPFHYTPFPICSLHYTPFPKHQVREICLGFLRIASLLKSHMMDERLPTIADPLAECGTLERYLDVWDTCSVVNTSVMGRMCGSLISDNGLSLNSTPSGGLVETQVGELSGAVKIWCSQVAAFASAAPMAAYNLLTNVRFFRAKLLTLPSSFDEVFQVSWFVHEFMFVSRFLW